MSYERKLEEVLLIIFGKNSLEQKWWGREFEALLLQICFVHHCVIRVSSRDTTIVAMCVNGQKMVAQSSHKAGQPKQN